MNKGDKVTLRFLESKYVGDERKTVFTDKSGSEIHLKHYPFLEKVYRKGTDVKCICTRADNKSVTYDVDMDAVYIDVYEDDCICVFHALELVKDMENLKKFIRLTDDYGMEHRLYHPHRNDIEKIGGDIECHVISISSSGLGLESIETQEENTAKPNSQSLFDKLHDSRVEDYKVFSKKDFKGVLYDTVNKYPDTAHFIYELLQNADDACATDVSFILKEDSLLFKHNGTVHFSVSDVDDEDITGHINSITAIGNSSKDDVEENKIGKFGVGFKSVFKYTSTPEIYDDEYRFKIENFIIPTRLEYDHDFREDGETLFVFPFNDPETAYNDIHAKLSELNNATLFLHSLRKIIWEDVTANEDGEFSKTIVSSTESRGIKCEKIVLDDDEKTSTLWLFSRQINIHGHGLFPICVGYYLRADGTIDTTCQPGVNCFFPTSESFGRCFISHAPFILVSSRQHLSPKEHVNEMLVNELIRLAADTLLELRDLGLLGTNLFDIIGRDEPYYYSFMKDDKLIRPRVIYKACIEKVKAEKLIISENGQYMNVVDLYIPQPANIKEVIDKETLSNLIGSASVDYVADGFERNTKDWNEIGVGTFNSSRLGSLLTSDFMAERDDAWLNKFFYFLLEDARSLWNSNSYDATFRRSPILLTKDSRWVSPFNNDNLNIYYDGPGADGYNVVDPSFAGLKNVKKFLEEIGCKEPDQVDYIRTCVLPKYAGQKSPGLYDIDRDFIVIYRCCQKIPAESVHDFISLLSERLAVATLDNDNKLRLVSPDRIYLDTPILKEYFKGDRNYLLYSEAYKGSIEEIGRDEFDCFMSRLGCRVRPRVINPGTHFYKLTESQHQALRDREKHCTSRNLWDKDIEGLRSCIERGSLDLRLSRQIWDWLIEIGPDNYKTLKVDLFYRTHDYRYCDSTVVEYLRSSKWLYNDDGTLSAPCDTSKEQLARLGYTSNIGLFTLLGIRSEVIDIIALGGSAEDADAYRLGKILKDLGIENEEDLKEYAQVKEEKRRREKKEKERKEKETNDRNAEVLSREELPNLGADTFSNVSIEEHPRTSANQEKTVEEKRAEQEQRIKDMKEKAENDLEKEIAKDELRESVDSMDKYSKEWFDALLALEYGADQKEGNPIGKSISISFGSVWREKDTERIYILKSPSKCPIPIAIEEIGGIEVQFSFRTREGFTRGFEVASVKDFTLRLKAKQADIDFLNGMDWKDCTKAEININNPAKLMGKLISAFKDLDKPAGFNFKDNLRNNVSFVFGPPGTGKTTYLARRINDLMDENAFCKILVLCPTNKACDVLTKKVHECTALSGEWLGRFVATGDEEIESMGLICNRDSRLYDEDRCCIVSTIARLPYDGFSRPGENWRLNEIDWDYVVIDEASMISLASITYAIYRFSSSKIIIAGDPFQLAPIVHEKKWENENIYSMINLNRFDNPVTEPIQFDIVNLETQYRSIPAIGRVFSEYSYAGKLKHDRENKDQMDIQVDGMALKPINIINFKVSRYDDVFGAKKLSGSNIQIYSVLLTVEICKYIAAEYARKDHKKQLSVGVICPYVAEAQMIEKLIEQQKGLPRDVTINVGTINGFQGDECDVIFAVFNPPVALAKCPDEEAAMKMFINNKRLVNVAISRAKDYLFVLIPHKDTEGWPWLKQIIRLGQLATVQKDDYTIYTSDDVERIIFGKPFYLENNSFVTTHQLANVYTDAAKKYEVRIDESSVDIQVEQSGIEP